MPVMGGGVVEESRVVGGVFDVVLSCDESDVALRASVGAEPYAIDETVSLVVRYVSGVSSSGEGSVWLPSTLAP